MKLSKVAVVAFAATVAVALPACGGSPQAAGSAAAEAREAEPVDLTGTWIAPGDSDDSWMELNIDGDTMTVYWVSDNGDTKSLYWAGSYTAPTEPGDTWEWDSANDHEQTDMALLASTSDTKTFTYENGEISWEVSALGTTTTARATRQE